MAKYLAHWEVGAVGGPVVAIDVIRAFTTAAYAFSAGAREIHLTETLAETYALLDANPTWLAMGEEHGRRPDRFALSNSPAHAAAADLDGRTIVQRTSAGTRGALAARRAEPLLCASLVVASATAAYLNTHAPSSCVRKLQFRHPRTVLGVTDRSVTRGRPSSAPLRTFGSRRSDDGSAVVASSRLEDDVPLRHHRGGQTLRRSVQAALLSSALLLMPVACATGDNVLAPSTSSSTTSSIASTAVTTEVPPSITSAAMATTTVAPRYTKGAPCSADVLAALLSAARLWATAHAAPGIVVTVASAQCADVFALGSMQCEYIDHPTWSCQRTGAIFQMTAGEWTLIREGDVDCSSEPDPAVRAACTAVGRTT